MADIGWSAPEGRHARPNGDEGPYGPQTAIY